MILIFIIGSFFQVLLRWNIILGLARSFPDSVKWSFPEIQYIRNVLTYLFNVFYSHPSLNYYLITQIIGTHFSNKRMKTGQRLSSRAKSCYSPNRTANYSLGIFFFTFDILILFHTTAAFHNEFHLAQEYLE